MGTKLHNNSELAFIQLETALNLYFNKRELISTIALASNAEEILGKLLKKSNKKNSLDELKINTCLVFKHLYNDEIQESIVADRANSVKNIIKHGNEKNYQTSFEADIEANNILSRAIDNYWKVNFELSPLMKRFQENSKNK